MSDCTVSWTPLRLLLAPIRLLLSAGGFFVFGLAGLFFRFPLAPWLNRERNLRLRHRRARLIVQRWFAVFVACASVFHLIRVKVIHPERLNRPGLLIVANHPSLLDIVCLLSLIPNGTTIVKAALTQNPFTAAPIEAAGYVNNGAGPEILGPILDDFESGASFVIFPEGTRTPSNLPAGEAPKLHRGAAALAFEAGRPFTPVRITASPRWLTKDRHWLKIPPVAMTLTLEVLEDIPLGELQAVYNERPAIACRKLTKILQTQLFNN